ncbi:phospho-N-acetylmuramoyl-pentapeptide-transferase [Candidatus Protochlamydia naegleriophila]|uniref:Phospho-N-acetylmuramoyl-pentapeptide-transferase n=1 Tax=Candidatus Protochlamydia naegleriophila TaxID=389348 RepID=A0A0U5JBS1_9BACT|nr:phospho-N-acetylmuramoyl-pentapeptide-transferase [Candidatus Protochlamydia naegleriophila]CUI16244.1 phospho-N-acetylmuramoyl-pentapeptide-transferase [Candidatus Protochlamydia naegleriophila]
MILFIIDYLKEAWALKVPAVFTYYSTRMILAAITSLLLSIFLGPYFIRKLYEMKIGQSIRKDECPLLGQLHEKKQNTPTMGGILILFSMVVSLLLWMDLTHVFTLILLITTFFLGLIGGRDDYLKLKYKNTKGMSAKGKLFFQFILSAAIASYFLINPINEAIEMGTWFRPPVIKEHVKNEQSKSEPGADHMPQTKGISLKDYASRLYIPFFKEPVVIFGGLSLLLMAFFMFFVITGSSNAANLTDGLDGLLAGCLIMAAGSLGLIAFVSNNLDIAGYLNILYIEGSGEIAIYLCALIGASLGFLWYNSHPAQVFMGDTGSLTLGGILGVSAVLLRREFLLGIVGGVFVAEALSVILQVASYRLRNKKRIFLCAPLHHHFEYKGWPETKVVIRFWIISLLFAIIGIASLKFQ